MGLLIAKVLVNEKSVCVGRQLRVGKGKVEDDASCVPRARDTFHVLVNGISARKVVCDVEKKS